MGHPRIVPSVVSHERRALGKCDTRPDSLIIVTNCDHMWSLGGCTCVMLLGCYLARCTLIQISVTPSDMGDGLIPVSKHNNETSFMIHMYYEMDVDYDNYLYHKLIDNTCMLSISCKPMMLSTLIWLKFD
jgi:hypothetical protein